MLRASITGAVVLLLILSTTVGPVASVGAPPATPAGSGGAASSAMSDVPSPALAQTTVNNSTTRHENPDDAHAEGDSARLKSYLAQQLIRSVGQSAVQISQGEYERGRALLGDAHSATLAKYVDVAGETGSAETAASFERATERQRSYAETVREYEETRAEYETARENGNESRARAKARELERLRQNVTTSGGELTAAYAGIANGTGADMDEPTRRIQERTRNVSATTEEITRATFEPTTLSATRVSDNGPISFTAPLQLAGRLTTTNGSAITSDTVRVAVGARSYTVTPDSDGRFTLTYAPVLLPVDNRTVTVRFRPRATTAYLGSNATLAVDVEPTTATASATAPPTASYGETLPVQGQVVANGTGVPTAPVRLTVGGRVLATTTTDANGSYQFAAPFPATVPTGTQTLRIEVPLTNRSIAAAPTESSITVAETATSLDLNASAVDVATVRIDGRLTTANGTPVRGQSLEIRFDGVPVTTLDTGRDGAVRAQVSVPDSLDPDANVTVVASFAGAGTNLAPASARTTVAHPGWTAAGTTGGFTDLGASLLWVAGLALLAVFVGVGFVARRRLGTMPAYAVKADQAATISPTASEVTRGDARLDLARARLDVGDNAATVELAFTAIRRRLEGQLDTDASMTHREFVTACTAAGVAELDAITKASSLYERAAFGSDAISTGTAETALALARTVLDRTAGPESAEPGQRETAAHSSADD